MNLVARDCDLRRDEVIVIGKPEHDVRVEIELVLFCPVLLQDRFDSVLSGSNCRSCTAAELSRRNPKPRIIDVEPGCIHKIERYRLLCNTFRAEGVREHGADHMNATCFRGSSQCWSV